MIRSGASDLRRRDWLAKTSSSPGLNSGLVQFRHTLDNFGARHTRGPRAAAPRV